MTDVISRSETEHADIDPMNCNLADLLYARCRQQPAVPAIITDTGSLSFSAFTALVDRLRAGLAREGVQPGDRVVSIAQKSPEAIALFFAVTASGAIYVPVNPALTAQETGVIISEAGACLMVMDNPDTRVVIEGVRHSTLGNLSNGPEVAETATMGRGNASAVMLFTSGTTGKPKGSVQTHRNLASNFASLALNWGMGPHDVLLHVLPVYHGHGLFLAAACPLTAGTTLRLVPKFDLPRILALLPDATVLMAVPTIHSRLLESEDFTAETCRNLRLVTSGSAPLPPELRDRFEARTGIQLLERYGSTETGMITSNPLHGERRRGSVGLPYEGVELRIVDPEGKEVGSGEVGRLFVRSPYINAGYWQKDGHIAPNVDDEGYFDTEDLVRQDPDGYLYVVGRAKDMIISGGLNIYPREVEIALEEIDVISEAVVVGVPHPDYGEAVLAVAAVKPGAVPNSDAIIAALANRLSGYKRPKRVEFVDALPRNDMGKVVKRALAERFKSVFTD